MCGRRVCALAESLNHGGFGSVMRRLPVMADGCSAGRGRETEAGDIAHAGGRVAGNARHARGASLAVGSRSFVLGQANGIANAWAARLGPRQLEFGDGLLVCLLDYLGLRCREVLRHGLRRVGEKGKGCQPEVMALR